MSAQEKYSGRHFCSVCQYSLNSDAELAIHEFSKKHCDNLLRLSKNRPVKTKTSKTVTPVPKKENVTETPQPDLSLYGYFNPPVMLVEKPKEYNTEYDPYLQKFAENPYKETSKPDKEVPIAATVNVTSFSKSKKKKKRMCQICNLSLMNIPEYEAHMKSSQHAWKLKTSGLGVSAHFVRASTDLHTTDKGDEASSGGEVPSISSSITSQNLKDATFSCDICHSVLNSQSQYQTHLTGKGHLEKMSQTQPKNLFCYSCKVSLTNFSQYNDHRNGKKHKARCRQLMREGITIPPEERPPDMAWSMSVNIAPVYPALYQSQILDKQTNTSLPKESVTTPTTSSIVPPVDTTTSLKESVISPTSSYIVPPVDMTTSLPKEKNLAPTSSNIVPSVNTMTGMHHCSQCSQRFSTALKLEIHIKSHVSESLQPSSAFSKTEKTKPNENQLPVVDEHGFKCSLCDVLFPSQPPFEVHLNSEDHALKIVDLKKKGVGSAEIICKVMTDRRCIRPDNYGRQCCGICAVVTNSTTEMEQHLQSLVHKYAEKDYKKKRMLEIQQYGVIEQDGSYYCRFCKQSWPKITDYNIHLHCSYHRNLFWKEHIKKNYILRWINKRRPKYPEPKNPGVRTKVGGTAKDLTSGRVEAIPNLETIEPKIDLVKNVNLGLSLRKGVVKNKEIIPARRLPGMVYRQIPGRPIEPSRHPTSQPTPMPPALLVPRESFQAQRMRSWMPPRFRPYPNQVYHDMHRGMRPPLQLQRRPSMRPPMREFPPWMHPYNNRSWY